MKKIWKFALAASFIAGLIPFRSEKDEETGASVKQALLWSYEQTPDGQKNYYIGLNVGKRPLPKADAIEEPEVLPVEEELPVEAP